MLRHAIEDLRAVTSANEPAASTGGAGESTIDPQMQRYIVHIVGLTGTIPMYLGASPAREPRAYARLGRGQCWPGGTTSRLMT